MAALSVTTMLGPYPATPASAGLVAVTRTAATAGPDTFAVQLGDIVLVRNTHISSTITVTIASVVDGANRIGDAVKAAIAASDVVAFGPITNTTGWKQSNGNLNVTVSGTGTAEVMILRLPS
jgi:hypothetical protein